MCGHGHWKKMKTLHVYFSTAGGFACFSWGSVLWMELRYGFTLNPTPRWGGEFEFVSRGLEKGRANMEENSLVHKMDG